MNILKFASMFAGSNELEFSVLCSFVSPIVTLTRVSSRDLCALYDAIEQRAKALGLTVGLTKRLTALRLASACKNLSRAALADYTVAQGLTVGHADSKFQGVRSKFEPIVWAL